MKAEPASGGQRPPRGAPAPATAHSGRLVELVIEQSAPGYAPGMILPLHIQKEQLEGVSLCVCYATRVSSTGTGHSGACRVSNETALTCRMPVRMSSGEASATGQRRPGLHITIALAKACQIPPVSRAETVLYVRQPVVDSRDSSRAVSCDRSPRQQAGVDSANVSAAARPRRGKRTTRGYVFDATSGGESAHRQTSGVAA
jgi:hypothetical protein